MRLVFCGTPADAVPALDAIVAAGHEVALVVTQPDRRRGRGSGQQPSPVRLAAEGHRIPVAVPERTREITDDVRALDAELGVVVAFGQLLPVALLEATELGFVNVHYSLLPRWRGAAPVERAIIAGDDETGVCVMRLEEGLDTGPVYACDRTPIGDHETAGELRARLTGLGSSLLVRTLPTVRTTEPAPQQGEPTSAAKLDVAEFRLDPRRSADELARLVRGGNPKPGAWVAVGGKRLKILRAHAAPGDGEPGTLRRPGELVAADGVLVLDEVEPSGKRAMTGMAWMHGVRDPELRIDGS